MTDEERERAAKVAYTIVGGEPAGWVVSLLLQYAAAEREKARAPADIEKMAKGVG